MRKYEKNLKLDLHIRVDGLFKIRLKQLALKYGLSESELLRQYVRDDYANYREKITSELKPQTNENTTQSI